MRRNLLTAIFGLFLMAILAACGVENSVTGGDTSRITLTVGGSSGNNTVSIKAVKYPLLAKLKGLFERAISTDSAMASMPASVRQISFTISAADMVTMTGSAAVSGDSEITQSFDVPNGSNRHFEATGLDASGASLYYGDAYANLNGSSVDVSINMQYVQSTLASIAISPALSSIARSTTAQFTANGAYSNGSSQDLSSVVNWSSSNTAVATVSVNGLVSGVAAGTATIRASYGGLTAETNFSVTNAVITSVALTPVNGSSPKGLSTQFAAIGTFSDFTQQDVTSLAAWTSFNTGIATISTTGLAAAIGTGSTTIRGAFGGASGTTTFTVTAAP